MIVLIGFMGAGKSTIGRLLAQRLRLPFVDSDARLEERVGRTIPEIFAEDGEPAFRDLEHRVIADVLTEPDAVVSLGGGAVQDTRTRHLLAGATVVYLRTGWEQAMARVGNDPGRPLLLRSDLRALFDARLPVYEAAADLIVDTTGRSATEVTAAALQGLERTISG